ncbi:MAG: hypothetical protein AB8G05_13010 [Oligoflexales bacterium]
MRYFTVFILFLGIIGFLQIKTSAERNIKYFYPDWYRISKNLNEAAKEGISNVGLIVGNSYTYTGVNPVLLDRSDIKYYNLARGGTSSVESMIWLIRNKVFPNQLLIELNSTHLSDRYFGKFSATPTNNQDKWFDIFKKGIEIDLRYFSSRYLPFVNYRINAIEIIKVLRAGGLYKLIQYMFLPDKRTVEHFKKVRVKHIDKGFMEDHRVFTKKEIEERIEEHTSDLDTYADKVPYSKYTAKILTQLSEQFYNNGTRVIFFRLPKNEAIISTENEVLFHQFEMARSLARDNAKVDYLDMTDKSILKIFTSGLSDGAHWLPEGAARISAFFAKKLETI